MICKTVLKCETQNCLESVILVLQKQEVWKNCANSFPKEESGYYRYVKKAIMNHNPLPQFSHGPYLTLKKVIGLTEAHQDKF